MKKLSLAFGSLVILLVSVFAATAETQLTDVVHLSDGKVLEGIIVEEEPGRTLTLLTADQETSVLPISKIVRIEKKLQLLESPIRYRDVVFLADGVIFRGTIVERVPKKSLTLELANGRLLEFQLQEVWKVAAERVTTTEVRPAPLDKENAEKIKVELQIQIVQRKSERRAKQQTEDSDAREEMDRLKKELEELEKERRQAEERLAQEEKRKEEVHGEWAPVQSQLQAAMDEMGQQLGACENPDAKARLEQVYDQIRQEVSRLVLQAQTVSLTAPPDPRMEQAAHEQAMTEVQALARSGAWKSRRHKQQFQKALSELSHAERQQIFREAKKKAPIGNSALNLIPLSLGSWSQGDILGASLATVAAWGGLLITVIIDEGWPYYLGASIGIGGWAYSLLQPFFYTAYNNNKLRDALGLEAGTGAAAGPKGGRS